MLAEETPALFRAFDLLGDRSQQAHRQAVRRAPRRAREADRRRAGPQEVGVGLGRGHADRQDGQERGALAAQRRGGDRQAARRDLQAGSAQGHGEDQAGADDRLRRRGLAAGQGGGHGRLADPRPLRGQGAAADRPHLRSEGEGEEGAGRRRSPTTRPARRAQATRAAGMPTAISSGSRCAPSWWSRSPTTTPAAAASATARRSSAGATTRRRRTARSTSWSRRHSCDGRHETTAGRERPRGGCAARRRPPRWRRRSASGSLAPR